MNLSCPHCSQTLELTPEVHAQLQGQPHFDCPMCQGLMAVPPMPASAPKQAPRRPADVQKAAMHAQRGLNRNMLVLGVTVLLLLGGLAAFLASRNGGSVFNIFQNITNQIIHNSYFTQLIASGVTTEKDLKSIGDIRAYGDGFIGVSKEPLAWEQAQDLAKRTGAEVLAIEDSAAGTRQQLTEWLNTTFASYLASTLWVRQDGQTRVLDKRDVMSVTSLDSPRKTTLQWQPNSGRTTTDPTVATKDLPFANTLGMKFVPVPDTQVLFCIHETRRQDYAAYAAAVPGVNGVWRNQMILNVPVGDKDNHPVVGVSYDDVHAFCEWLSKREGKTYRLPTDKEWSYAVGIGSKEKWTPDTAAKVLTHKTTEELPWGGDFPPQTKDKAGNYADNTWKTTFPEKPRWIEGYTDGFPTTSPVMSFKPNQLGLYDLGGNAWEWVEDWWSAKKTDQMLRGGCFADSSLSLIQSSGKAPRPLGTRMNCDGFRIVLEVATQNAKAAAPQESAAMRRAAEWVHAIGGRLQVIVKGRNQTIQSTDELPTEPFKVTEVLLDGRGKAKITGASLPRLDPLTELVSLKLPAQDIGDEDLHHLANFTELEHLELNWNSKINGAGFQHLKALPRFRSLDLRGVNIRDVGFEHMMEMENLDHLDLTGVPITSKGIQCLGAMKKLRFLIVIGATSINDDALGTFGQLSELTNLYADSEQITDAGVGHLKALKKIVHLNLGSSHITGASLETLGQMTSLRHLLLDGTAIQDNDLQRLSGLNQLSGLFLWNCKVTDAGLEHLKALTALKGVELKGTQVTDAGAAALQATMPRLKIIR